MSCTDVLSLFLGCFSIPSSQAKLKINGNVFSIIKLLGEGGFSYVYLVESRDGSRYALKKIRCAYGAESIKNAIREVEAYKEFSSPYIIKAVDTSIVEERDGSKTVYILLPYYENGTLQDLVTQNVIKNNKIEEQEALRLFIGICRALQVMHRHKLNSVNTSGIDGLGMELQRLTRDTTKTNTSTFNGDELDALNSELNVNENDILLEDSEDDDTETEADDATTLPGSIVEQSVAKALNSNSREDNSFLESTELKETVPYAHRDIKPANVMLSSEGMPVLCDLGSCSKARISIKKRSQALQLQDMAAEHCTLPYRAPELLDVSTGAEIDERTDIWSLGCLLYALLYGSSPFERAEAESGASMSLAIGSGKYEFPSNPSEDGYSDDIKGLIKMCLVVDPASRPSIEQVLSKALSLR